MVASTMERKESFDALFDNIDADAEETTTRGRGTDRKSAGKDNSSSRSRSKPRAKSKTRSSGKKAVVAKDLFGGGSDSDESCKSTKSKSSSRRGKLNRSASARSSASKKDKAASNQNKKVVANDIFGDSLSDLNHSDDEKTVSSSRPSSKKGDSQDQSNDNIPWNDTDTALNQKEFEKMARERATLKKLVEDLKKENVELRREVRNSDDENRKLRQSLADGAGNSHKLKTLEEENQRLQLELRETVGRASAMVKEREAATEQLVEELEKLREETHETRKMFDVTLFKNKKKTEELDHQNDQYARRIQQLEQYMVVNNDGKKKK